MAHRGTGPCTGLCGSPCRADPAHQCTRMTHSLRPPPPQVYRATLRARQRGYPPLEVAVKVRHPGVADAIRHDFQLLRPLAALTSRVRSLKVRRRCRLGWWWWWRGELPPRKKGRVGRAATEEERASGPFRGRGAAAPDTFLHSLLATACAALRRAGHCASAGPDPGLF